MPTVFLPSGGGFLSGNAEAASSPHNVPTNPFHTADNEGEDEQSVIRGDKRRGDEINIISGTESDVTGPQTLLYPTAQTANTTHTQPRTSKPTKRYSVQRPSRAKSKRRQKRQNEKAGIKLVTNFPQSKSPGLRVKQPVQLETPRITAPATGFVDLAALQVLDNQAPKPNGGIWKSIRGIMPGGDSGSSNRDAADISKHPDRSSTENAPVSIGGFNRLAPPCLQPEADLSPCDRPIVIGISVPPSKLAQHVSSPQTASSDTSRILESYVASNPREEEDNVSDILVSSPRVLSAWSPLEPTAIPPQKSPTLTASSVYSRATDLVGKQSPTNVPQLFGPLDLERQSTSRSPASTVFAEDGELTSPGKSRVKSSHTVFEEDESPILHQMFQANSIQMPSGKNKPVSIVTTMDHRRSKGWWDAIVTPFLTRSNPFSPLHNATEQRRTLTDTEMNSQIDWKDSRKWETSLSPKTPETSTTIASDAWWDKRTTIAEDTKLSECGTNTAGSDCYDEDSGTLPFALAIENSTAMPLQNEDVDADLTANARAEAPPEITETWQRNSPTVSQAASSPNTTPFNGEASPMASDSISPEAQDPQNGQNDIHPVGSLERPQMNNITTNIVISEPPRTLTNSENTSMEEPPPQYSPPRPTFRKYRAVFPPDVPRNYSEPLSPGPTSLGAQQEMPATGGIALNDVRHPTPERRPINLNSGYSGPSRSDVGLPYTPDELGISKKSRKAEAKRRKYEKEDALTRDIGNTLPDRRGGTRGRKKRKCYCWLIAGFLIMIILILSLVLGLNRSHNSNIQPQQSSWLNLTGFPPIFTGISTISAPDNPVANTGCVFPSTMWSCALPKELQSSVAPNPPNQPNFKLQIQWDNSTATNATFANVTGNPNLSTRGFSGNAVRAGFFIRKLLLKARQSASFSPSPAAPSYAEQFFLGNTTDGIASDQKAGEPTPFFISFLSTATTINLQGRDQPQSNPFPNVSSLIPEPEVNSDGTAAPANLLPYPVQQPLRLYDRGLPTEHYGFYTYYNRSIFLKSTSPLNESNIDEGEVPDDRNGGSREAEATVRCTWAETRFLVQIWTRKNMTARLVGSPSSSASLSASDIANDYTRPGSFPYPATITLDRHGGDPTAKLLYCYSLDPRERPTTFKLQQENKGFGGGIINQAPSIFVNNSDPNLGGFDGGSGGCKCQWQNWIGTTSSK